MNSENAFSPNFISMVAPYCFVSIFLLMSHANMTCFLASNYRRIRFLGERIRLLELSHATAHILHNDSSFVQARQQAHSGKIGGPVLNNK